MRAALVCIYLIFMAASLSAQPGIKWSFNTKDASFGQSAAADIDGDGKLEIVFGCYRNDSMIYALNAEDGSLLWKFNAKSATAEGCNDVAPIFYDVDNDGQLEVIVPGSCNPKTFCLNGKTGAVKWTCNTRGSDSPPTIADIDNDGKPEVLHGEFGGYVICMNAGNGTVKWEIPVDSKSWIQTAPSILDIGNDGDLDFVVATWNATNRQDNNVYAYRGKDQKLLWTHALSDVVYHGSAIGDLDNDGKQEIIIGCYNDTLYCLRSDSGTVQWKYSLGNYYYVGGPAQIADLNNDGRCEVVFTAWYAVVALTWDGKLFWRYDIPNYKQSFRGAAIADINNDAYPDVVLGTDGGDVLALNGNNGTSIFSMNLRSHYGDSLYNIDHAPLVSDFDKDGKMDVFIVGGHAEYPNFYKDFGRAYMLSVAKGNGPDWLMFQQNIRRTSNVCLSHPSAVTALHYSNTSVRIAPNPFYDNTTIFVELEHAATVQYRIQNIQGVEVGSMSPTLLAAGTNPLIWKAPTHLPAGIYYCTLLVDGVITRLKMQVL